MSGNIEPDGFASLGKQEKFSKLLKDNIIEALEELRLKRKLELENADRVNGLLKEKFDLCHEKEELTYKYEKKIEELVLKLTESERNLQETYEKLQCLEKRKVIHQQTESESMKILKEEVVALQLAKHNLEKKWKDQESQYDMHTAAKESLMLQFRALQERVQSVEEHRNQIRSELMKLESAVQKASLFQNRILRINNHQQCNLEESKAKLIKAFDEITKHKATINNITASATLCSQSEDASTQRPTEPTNDFLREKLEEQTEQLIKENKRLMDQLSTQATLVKQLSDRIAAMSNSEMGLQFEIDDLNAENLILKDSLKMNKDCVDKEIQTDELVLGVGRPESIENVTDPEISFPKDPCEEVKPSVEVVAAISGDSNILLEESVMKEEAQDGTNS